jgi:hypothetical protein
MRLPSKLILLLASVATGVVLAAAGAEVVLRFAKGTSVCVRVEPGERPNAVPGVSWAALQPELGWVATDALGPVNPQGFRDSHDFDRIAIAPDRKRLMVLGDSFMWGAQVAPHESVPAFLQQKLGDSWDVFNVSAPGWGIDQMVLAYFRYRDAIRPDVVLLAYIDEDVDRVLDAYRPNEGMNKPSFRLHDGELVARTTAEPVGALTSLGRRSAAFRCLEREVDRMVDAPPIALALLRKLATETRERSEELRVVRIPLREIVDTRLGRIRWRLARLDELRDDPRIEYMELVEPIERSGMSTADLYVHDGHLSPKGASVVADALASTLSARAAPR